jgi:hypothetical protein
MNLLCNYSGQLSEVTGATLAGANYKTWNDIYYLQTKLDDWYLFTSVLRFAREKDSREREKLENLITRSARKSCENNIQIAMDFVAALATIAGLQYYLRVPSIDCVTCSRNGGFGQPRISCLKVRSRLHERSSGED